MYRTTICRYIISYFIDVDGEVFIYTIKEINGSTIKSSTIKKAAYYRIVKYLYDEGAFDNGLNTEGYLR